MCNDQPRKRGKRAGRLVKARQEWAASRQSNQADPLTHQETNAGSQASLMTMIMAVVSSVPSAPSAPSAPTEIDVVSRASLTTMAAVVSLPDSADPADSADSSDSASSASAEIFKNDRPRKKRGSRAGRARRSSGASRHFNHADTLNYQKTALVHAGSQASLTITAVFSSASSASAEGREVLYKDAYKPRRPQYRESSSGPWRPFAGGDAPLRLTKCLDAKSKDIAPKVLLEHLVKHGSMSKALANEALGWIERNAVRVASILTADMENAKAEEQRITVQKVSTSVRLWVLQRDGQQCGYCFRRFEDPRALTVDHVIPGAAGGPSQAWNLLTCCHGCNNCKSDFWIEDLYWGREGRPYGFAPVVMGQPRPCPFSRPSINPADITTINHKVERVVKLLTEAMVWHRLPLDPKSRFYAVRQALEDEDTALHHSPIKGQLKLQLKRKHGSIEEEDEKGDEKEEGGPEEGPVRKVGRKADQQPVAA